MSDEVRVAGWASVAISAEVDADSSRDVDSAQAREALADVIEDMDADEIRNRLLTDIEWTETIEQ